MNQTLRVFLTPPGGMAWSRFFGSLVPRRNCPDTIYEIKLKKVQSLAQIFYDFENRGEI